MVLTAYSSNTIFYEFCFFLIFDKLLIMAEKKEASTQFVEAASQLARVVDRLDRDFTKRRSRWYGFSYGLLQGIGFAFGATVLFVIIFYALLAMEDWPIFGNFASQINDQIFFERELIQ
jgi:hypothetical protein